MGWDIDICQRKVKEILGDRPVGFVWDDEGSLSPIRIAIQGELTDSEREQIVEVFPWWIRVELRTYHK